MKKLYRALAIVTLSMAAVASYAMEAEPQMLLIGPDIDLTYAEPVPPDKVLDIAPFELADVDMRAPAPLINGEDADRHRSTFMVVVVSSDALTAPDVAAPFEVGWQAV